MQKKDLKKINLPNVPGVYLFKRGRVVLYVGKATNLRDRVRSYFDIGLIRTRGPRLVDIITKADRVLVETTPTVLEALVREAALIKKYKPIGNTEGKDDSTFMYAVVTKEDIPRVLSVRGKDLDLKNKVMLTPTSCKLQSIFGPFPSGAQLKEGLRLIRRIFQFFDTPKPITHKSKHQLARIEFNKQIHLYPQQFNKNEYRKTIRRVQLLLAGRGKELRLLLKREMRAAAKDERFEDAAETRHELFVLDHIHDVSLLKSDRDDSRENLTSAGYRIEAYDTAHLSGTNAIGVMTVVIDGEPIKSQYRTFRIRGHGQSDDIGFLKEIISRRLTHYEWEYPKIIVVDGGKTHKKAAETVLAEFGIAIPVVAVVKNNRHRPREVIGAIAAGIKESDAVLANAEAHRFSLARHRLIRSSIR